MVGADLVRSLRSAFVVAESVSAIGGAPKATRLLCDALRRLCPDVRLFVRQPPGRQLRRDLEQAGIRVVRAVVTRGSRWELAQRSLALQAWFHAVIHRPDIIHTVGLTSEARHLLRLRPPVPVYLWETTEALPHVKFVDMAIAPLLGRARALLAPSTTIGRNARATYGYSGEVRLLPFWVDEPPPGRNGSPHARSANFLFVGRLDPDKGLADLFHAFRNVVAQHGRATLTICGSGPTEPLRDMASSVKGIDVRGYVDPEKLERAMERCDAVVLPSLHEGYPLSLLEACARRRPVIATSVGSIPEVFGGNACALLVPPRDPAALSAAMCQLLDEPDDAYRSRCDAALTLFRRVSAPCVVDARLAAAYRDDTPAEQLSG